MSHNEGLGDSASNSPEHSPQSPLSLRMTLSSSGGSDDLVPSPVLGGGAQAADPQQETARLAALRLSSVHERLAREDADARRAVAAQRLVFQWLKRLNL